MARRERMKILTQRADALLAEAQHLDVELAEVITLLKQRQGLLQTANKK